MADDAVLRRKEPVRSCRAARKPATLRNATLNEYLGVMMPSRFRKAARVAKFGVLPSFVLVGLGGCGLTPSVNATRVPSEVPVQAPAPTGPDVGGSAPKLAWARTDKRLISGNPELTAQAQADIAECYAVSPPVRTAAGVPGEPCMEKRGYYVREL
jgi:hypothetical protein